MLRLSPLLFLAALLGAPALAPTLHAQSATLTGRVVDADSELPLPTATVALLLADSLVTGATTDFDGAFRIAAEAGTYDVRVTFVGYDEVLREGVAVGPGETALGTVALEPAAALLDGVTVAGERPQRQARIDRTVYDTADDPVAEGGNATDVLSTIPSVEVDIDGNLSLRGSGGVAVFINGRPAPVSGEFVAGYLQSLPAGSIERVEVIPNPSAAFEPDGVGGIINIVLKRDADPGLAGTVTGGTSTQGGFDGSATVTYGKGKWSLAGTYGFRNDVRAGGGTSYRIDRDDDLVAVSTLDQIEDEDRTRTSHLFNLSADYSLSRRTVLTSQVQFGTRTGDETELNTADRALISGDLTSAYERVSEELDDGRSADLRLGLRHSFADDHRLTVEARGEASTEEEAQRYDEFVTFGGIDPAASRRADETEDERELSFQADYSRPLFGFTVDAGYKGDFEREESGLLSDTLVAGDWVPDDGANNAFVFDQVINALYLQAGREWGAWELQAGLRFEDARTTFDLENTGERFDNDYRSLFPSAFLSYAPTETLTLRGGYSRRINRPSSRSLNPFQSFDDPENIRQGNPALKPEYVDAVEVSATQLTGWGSLSVTPYYRRTTDVIRRDQFIRDDGVTVFTSINLDTAESWGAEGVLSYDADPLRGYLSLEGYRIQTEGATSEEALSNDAFGWGGRANASYRFGNRTGLGDLDLQATVRYRAPIETERGRRGAFTWMDLALRQKLLRDRASLTLQLRDPFDLAGFSYTLDQPRRYQERERNWGAQQIGLTFSYTFGQQDRRQNRRRGEGDGGDFDGGEDF